MAVDMTDETIAQYMEHIEVILLEASQQVTSVV